MIRNPYGRPYQPRRLQFPVPEDIFASDDDVTERDEKEIRSPAIDRAIDNWNIAKKEGDEHGLRTAAKGIVNATSAAFKLQGVPTFAHPVLPPQFVKAEAAGLAGLTVERRDGALSNLLSLFDPSVKPGGKAQFDARLNALRGPESLAEIDKSGGVDTRPAATFPQHQQGQAQNGSQARQAQHQSPQQQPASQRPTWWRQEELLPEEEGGEAGLKPTPSPNGPFARPKRDKEPAPGFEYEAWEQKADPKTSTGAVLVPPRRLTRRQQENLLGRNWISPTGKTSGAGRLEEGYGYFGADRAGPGNTTVHHGAYDAPFKYPSDPDFDVQGKPIKYERTVRLPTRATYLGFVPHVQNDPVYGKRTINMFRFSLGDGIILEMLHVEPSPAFLSRLAAAQRTGAPLEFDAGEILGDVDGDHDHTHIQIRVSGPNGEKWVVDPTYFLEKRARTFLRAPLPDLIDDAIDWGIRQFE
jgi:hypothetical protein